MAHSDRYRYQIGDQVRSRHSGEEGRVVNLVPLADGALLMTVAIFVAGLRSHEVKVTVGPNAIGGEYETVARPAVAAGAVEAVRRPHSTGTEASAVARAAASVDDPVRDTMASVVKDRLQTWSSPTKRGAKAHLIGASPSVEQATAEVASDNLFDKIKDFNRTRDSVFQQKGQIDVHLSYLSAPGEKDGGGQWLGSYLSDVVFGRRAQAREVLKKVAPLERLLSQTRIPIELRTKYGSLIPQGTQTGYDLLIHARLQMSHMAGRDAAILWKDYTAILSEAVRLTPGYQELVRQGQDLSTAIDNLTGSPRATLENEAGAASRAYPGLDNSAFGTRGYTGYQVGEWADLENRFTAHGYEAEGLDRGWLNQVLREKRRARRSLQTGLTPQSPTTGRGAASFYPGVEGAPGLAERVTKARVPRVRTAGRLTVKSWETVGVRDIGRDAAAAVEHDARYLQRLQQRVGTVVEYNRVPHIVSAIDAKTLNVTLTPAGSDAVLYARGVLNSTEEMAAFTRRLAETGFQKASKVEQAAQAMSKRVAATSSVRIRGGLLGKAAGSVEVPVNLLKQYIGGGRLPANRADLYQLLTHQRLPSVTAAQLNEAARNLGAGSIRELEQGMATYGGKFHRLLDLPSLATLGASERLLEAEDVHQTAWALALQHVHTLPQDLSMGEVAQNLAGQVKTSLKRSVVAREQVYTTQFSNLGAPAGLAERLAAEGQEMGEEDVLGARGATNIFQAATDTPVTTRMLQTEFEHRLRVQAKTVGAHSKHVIPQQGGVTPAGSVAAEVERETAEAIAGKSFARQGARTIRTGADPLDVFRLVFRDFVPDAEDVGGHMVESYTRQLSLAEQATRLGASLHRGTAEKSALRELADRLGIELVEGSSGLNGLYRLYAAARQKAGGRLTPEVRRLAKQLQVLQGSEFAALDALGLAGQEAALPFGGSDSMFHVEPSARAHLPGVINPLIEAAEAGDFSHLQAMGLEFDASQRGRVGVTLYGDAEMTDPFTYYRHGESTGYAVNKKTRAVIPLGIDPTTLTERGIHEALESGALHLKQHEGEPLTAEQFARQTAAGENWRAANRIRARAIEQTNRTLPFLQSEDGTLLGLSAPDPVNRGKVIENTRRLLREEGRMIGLDIETDIETGRLTHFFAEHYQVKEGKVVTTGERLDIATPEFFRGGLSSAADRIVEKNGRLVEIDKVVDGEADIVRQAAAYLKRNEEMVVGHNITGFDLTHLLDAAKRHGLTPEYKTLHGVAESRLADTMLAYQAAYPGAGRISQEDIYRRHLDSGYREAHVASTDTPETMALLPVLRERAAEAEARLASAREVRMHATQFIWDTERQRGYRFRGTLDSQQVDRIYRQHYGDNIPQGAVGIALQPIDFMTGKAEGALEFRSAATPHGFAKQFMGSHDLLPNRAALDTRMQETVEDLARRRVRRTLHADFEKKPGEGSFTNLMLEEGRLKLGAAAARGELEQAKASLFERLQAGGTANEEDLLRRHMGWADWLNDSRGTKQLELEHRFFSEEIEGAHAPVIDWLKAHVNAASKEGLAHARQEANAVWNQYIQQTQSIQDFSRITDTPIPLSRRKATIELGVLGAQGEPVKVALGVGTQERLQRGLDTLTHRIAKRLDTTGELSSVMGNATQAEREALRQRLYANKNILDNPLGETVQRHIEQQHLLPALQRARLSVEHGSAKQLALEAGSLHDLIPQVLQQGRELAQQSILQKPDNLTPRSFSGGALHELQQSFIGQAVGQVHRAAADPKNLVLDLRHNAPQHWVGRSVHDLIEEAGKLGPEGQDDFRRTLRSVARNMNRGERGQLTSLLSKGKQNWLDQVMHVGAGPARAEQFGEAVRALNPSVGHSLGMKAISSASEHSEAMFKGGLGAAALLGGLLAIHSLIAPSKPRDPQPQEEANGFASSPNEQANRYQKVLQQQLQTNHVAVHISGIDPEGLDHHELMDSVHQSLGAFFGRKIAVQQQVHDHRQAYDRNYLDRVAAQLLTDKKHGIQPGL